MRQNIVREKEREIERGRGREWLNVLEINNTANIQANMSQIGMFCENTNCECIVYYVRGTHNTHNSEILLTAPDRGCNAVTSLPSPVFRARVIISLYVSHSHLPHLNGREMDPHFGRSTGISRRQ